MTSPTGSDLSSLHGEMEIEILEFCRKQKRTSTVFCRKYGDVITLKFAEEHHCFRPKRVYTNKEGERCFIYCPNLYTTQMKPFYEVYKGKIYETGNAIYGLKVETKRKAPQLEEKAKEDIFTKQAKTLGSLVKAGRKLTSGSA